MTEKNKVALIGAGAMGGAIGTRLIETGNQLTVFDLDAEKVAALTSLGAQSAGTAAEAASVSDVVILSLNSPKIVRIAVFGKDGVAAGAKPGTLIIDMSSIDPEATKAWATDLAARHEGRIDGLAHLVGGWRGGKPIDPSRTCRATTREGVERRCASLLPRVASEAGVDVTALRGEITELNPAQTTDTPVVAALLTA